MQRFTQCGVVEVDFGIAYPVVVTSLTVASAPAVGSRLHRPDLDPWRSMPSWCVHLSSLRWVVVLMHRWEAIRHGSVLVFTFNYRTEYCHHVVLNGTWGVTLCWREFATAFLCIRFKFKHCSLFVAMHSMKCRSLGDWHACVVGQMDSTSCLGLCPWPSGNNIGVCDIQLHRSPFHRLSTAPYKYGIFSWHVRGSFMHVLELWGYQTH